MISHHEPAWGTEAEPMPALASPIREGSLVCADKKLLASSAAAALELPACTFHRVRSLRLRFVTRY